MLAAHPDMAPWTLRFEEAVVLLGGAAPLRWSSRTLAGRRRQFTDRHLRGAAPGRVWRWPTSDHPRLVEVRSRFERRHHAELSGAEPAARAFEDRPLRRAFVGWLWDELGREPTVELLARRHRRGRARRPATPTATPPIQGGVADAMLAAYAELWAEIGADAELLPAVTVHDSLAVECPVERAEWVASAELEALRRGFARWCPDVPLAVDVDVRTSLSDADVVRSFTLSDPTRPMAGRR